MKESTNEKVVKAHDLLGKWRDAENFKRQVWWIQAKALKEMKDGGYFKFVDGDSGKPDNNGRWKDFCRAEDIPYSTADYYITVYRKWIIELGFKEKELYGINPRKLHTAIKFAATKEKADIILENARQLDYYAFSEFLKKDL